MRRPAIMILFHRARFSNNEGLQSKEQRQVANMQQNRPATRKTSLIFGLQPIAIIEKYNPVAKATC